MPKLITKYAPALAAFGVLTSSSFAVNAQNASHAAERPSVAEIPSVAVRYADLNLSTPAGVEVLYARLRSAAREVCNVREKQALAQTIESKTCYERAFGAAVNKVTALAPFALDRAGRAGDRLD